MRGYKNKGWGSICLKNFYLFLFVAIISSVSGLLFAQDYHFRHYNVENGLSQSQVVSVYQDSQKYLWLGTYGGISRFNGIDFINYTKMDGLNDDVIISTCQDKDKILFLTLTGISSIEDGVVKNLFKFPIENWRSSKDLIKDNKGNIWFINGWHLNKFSEAGVVSVSITSSKDELVQTLCANEQGKLFAVVYGKGIYGKIDNKWVNILPFSGIYKKEVFTKMLFDNTNPGKIYLLTSKRVYVANSKNILVFKNKIVDRLKDDLFSMAQDKQGCIWLGTARGALYLRDKDFVRFTGSNGFTNSKITDIYIDHDNNAWLATYGDGFYKFEGFDLISIKKINNSPFQLFDGIGLDDANNIWAGTYGQGLVKYDGAKLTNIGLPSTDRRAKYVLSIGYKKGQPLLFGTMGGLWALDHGKFDDLGKKYHLPNFVNIVIYDSNNTIWMITNKGIYYLKSDGKVSSLKDIEDPVQTFVEIGRDSILLGVKHGLILVKNGLIDTGFNKFNKLSSNTVISLMRSGNLIFGGTLSEGLFSIDILKNRLTKYTTRNGLKSNGIYSLAADQYGTIWAGTGKGIEKFKIEPKTQKIQLINNVFPNPVEEFNQNAILYYQNKIWAGTTKGIDIFNAIPSSDIESQQPVINIESVKITDQKDNKIAGDDMNTGTKIPKILKSSYGHKHISIVYRGILYADPENLQYQYRLKGFDQEFSTPSKFNRVDFTVISPGNYVFEVRAVTANGIFSAIKSLPIIVTPAVYQTTYFYIFLLVLLISLGILIQGSLTYRKSRQRLILESVKHEEQVRIRRQTAEDFHDDIGNKLTRIVILTDILDRKSKSKSGELKSLINQIRENAANLYADAKDILWALDPQSDNLHEVIQRIKDFAIDLFSNTDIELTFNDFDLYCRKPLPLEFSRNLSMIFKELLNNILKHANATQVTLSATYIQNEVEIVLIDNGKGFVEAKQTHGRGLPNIKIRAERINGVITIDSKPGRGTKTTLRFKLGA
jgi:signal transduction histidine kinase/ligand-binding sensor domain-containing protein